MKNKSRLMILAILVIAMSSVAQVTGSFTDSRDGKMYKTVKIGSQTWMAENLAYKASSGCWAYDNNPSNVKTYGYLYNWETAKKICPSGWHLSTDAEWTTLTSYLGSGSVAGGKLKETGNTHWQSPNKGATNETGFTALAGGDRYVNGAFDFIGHYGYWWSSTECGIEDAWYRGMSYNYSDVGRSDGSKTSGFSVRCIRD